MCGDGRRFGGYVPAERRWRWGGGSVSERECDKVWFAERANWTSDVAFAVVPRGAGEWGAFHVCSGGVGVGCELSCGLCEGVFSVVDRNLLPHSLLWEPSTVIG